MNRKNTALVLAAVMCLSFASCGNSDPGSGKADGSASAVKAADSSSTGGYDALAVQALENMDVADDFDYQTYGFGTAKQIFEKASGYYDAVGIPADGDYTEASEGELYKAVKDMSEYPSYFEIIVEDGKLSQTKITFRDKESKLFTYVWTADMEESNFDYTSFSTSAADSSADSSSVAEKVIEDYQAYCDEWCRQVLGMAQCIINGVGMGDGVPIPDGVYTKDVESSVTEYIDAMLEPEGDYVVTIENGVAVTSELTIHDKEGNEYHSVYSLK